MRQMHPPACVACKSHTENTFELQLCLLSLLSTPLLSHLFLQGASSHAQTLTPSAMTFIPLKCLPDHPFHVSTTPPRKSCHNGIASSTEPVSLIEPNVFSKCPEVL